MTRYTIEMTTPDDLDQSALLERMQEVAVELAEADAGGELSERTMEAIRDEVSVTLWSAFAAISQTIAQAERALGAAEGKEDLARSMRIHGFPIVGFVDLLTRRDGRQGRVVLVDRGEDGGDNLAHDRWVTGVHFIGDDEWSHGHYFDDLDDARADLYERAKGR
jgi:hypothetical protein